MQRKHKDTEGAINQKDSLSFRYKARKNNMVTYSVKEHNNKRGRHNSRRDTLSWNIHRKRRKNRHNNRLLVTLEYENEIYMSIEYNIFLRRLKEIKESIKQF